VSALLVLLLVYSIGLIVLGAWVGRGVRRSAEFFVAGRSLGAGLLGSTFLAANIGAGSTLGATGYAYTHGLAAWWWNGSAALGSLVLAFWVGPRLWRSAQQHGFLTVGDFLEHAFGREVRTLAATFIWLGSFLILCGQLRGAAEVLQAAAGWSIGLGAFVSAVATVGYFVFGGLISAAWVNVVQFAVILVGFLVAAQAAGSSAGDLGAIAADTSFWRSQNIGWPLIFLLAPAFFLSPGLVQKAYGARDAASLRRGVALNGLVLLAFAWLPVVLGLSARALHPDLARPEQALPTVLSTDVPPFVGALGMAAVFSAVISSADAVLFMLATSGARDFYRGVLRPQATDADVLRTARIVAVLGGVIGYLLTFLLDSVESALTIFYSVMIVTLFAPILGGLYLPRAGRWSALAAMLVGVGTLAATHLATGGLGYGWAQPSFIGLVASGLTYLVLAVF
jgi:SSS family solute:Na+ symporter